jgi:hypothetical protein
MRLDRLMRCLARAAGSALAALVLVTRAQAQEGARTAADASTPDVATTPAAAVASAPAANEPGAHTAAANNGDAALAERLARSLVRVEVADAHGLGVIVGGAGRVLTAYALIDRADTPSLIFANGARVPARVVDWNAATGAALLEPASRSRGEPLALATGDADVGSEVLLPDFASAPAEREPAPLVPVLGTGRVSGARAGSLWVDALFGPDDLGRPIVSREGALLGVVVASADAAEGTPLTRARVAAASTLAPLAGSSAQRDDFEPTSRAHWQKVSGLVTVPLARDGLLGAGFQFGWRRDWFVGLIREGFVVNGFAPQSSTTYERVQRRAFFELEAEAQLALGRTRLFAGAGAVILADNIERRVIDDVGIIDESREHTIRVRPLATLGMNTDPLEVSIAAYIGDEIETRLGIGLIWGR